MQVDQPTRSTAIQVLIPELRVIARKLVNRSAHAPEDLVHDVLMTALRNWHQLPPGPDLRPWLLGILSDRARTIGDPGLAPIQLT